MGARARLVATGMAKAFATAVAVGLILGAAACAGGNGLDNDSSGGNRDARPTTQAAGSAATGTTAQDESFHEGPVMDGDHAVIQQEAVGPLRVGEWRRPVMSFVYAISARAGRDSEDIIVVRGIGKDTVTLTFDNDTLRRVFVTHQGPHTADGIGVGTPFATVAAAPGASTARRGSGKVVTIARMCGVEFATDSVALAPDSTHQSRAANSPTIRAISVGYCKR
jgi:hypothetical protein